MFIFKHIPEKIDETKVKDQQFSKLLNTFKKVTAKNPQENVLYVQNLITYFQTIKMISSNWTQT